MRKGATCDFESALRFSADCSLYLIYGSIEGFLFLGFFLKDPCISFHFIVIPHLCPFLSHWAKCLLMI